MSEVCGRHAGSDGVYVTYKGECVGCLVERYERRLGAVTRALKTAGQLSGLTANDCLSLLEDTAGPRTEALMARTIVERLRVIDILPSRENTKAVCNEAADTIEMQQNRMKELSEEIEGLVNDYQELGRELDSTASQLDTLRDTLQHRNNQLRSADNALEWVSNEKNALSARLDNGHAALRYYAERLDLIQGMIQEGEAEAALEAIQDADLLDRMMEAQSIAVEDQRPSILNSART